MISDSVCGVCDVIIVQLMQLWTKKLDVCANFYAYEILCLKKLCGKCSLFLYCGCYSSEYCNMLFVIINHLGFGVYADSNLLFYFVDTISLRIIKLLHQITTKNCECRSTHQLSYQHCCINIITTMRQTQRYPIRWTGFS